MPIPENQCQGGAAQIPPGMTMIPFKVLPIPQGVQLPPGLPLLGLLPLRLPLRLQVRLPPAAVRRDGPPPRPAGRSTPAAGG